MQSCVLHGSETWSVRKENKMAAQQDEMKIITWICGVKVTYRFTYNKMTDRLRIDDIIQWCSKSGSDSMGMF